MGKTEHVCSARVGRSHKSKRNNSPDKRTDRGMRRGEGEPKGRFRQDHTLREAVLKILLDRLQDRARPEDVLPVRAQMPAAGAALLQLGLAHASGAGNAVVHKSPIELLVLVVQLDRPKEAEAGLEGGDVGGSGGAVEGEGEEGVPFVEANSIKETFRIKLEPCAQLDCKIGGVEGRCV